MRVSEDHERQLKLSSQANQSVQQSCRVEAENMNRQKGFVFPDQMPETPSRSAHHRRTQSETFFPFLDEDIIIDDAVADFNFTSFDLLSLSDDTSAPTGDLLLKPESKSHARKSTGYSTHLRSLSVDSDFFEELWLSSTGDGGYRHRHSNSMDGSAATSFERDSVLMLLDNSKKALAPDKLAELN